MVTAMQKESIPFLLGVAQNTTALEKFIFMKEIKMEIGKTQEVKKEWGKELWMANTSLYCGKKLILNKGKRVSLHKHRNKDETFYIDEGRVLMELEGDIRVLKPGDVVRIKPGALHRYTGLSDVVIIEISTHHEDDDTYREEGQLSGDAPKEIMEKYS